MPEVDYSQVWYHGSQQSLSVLDEGSSITQNRTIAQVFSHRPSLVSWGRVIRHNGTMQGYLYIVDEPISPEDVYPHPHPVNVARWEWVTRRPLRVRLLEYRSEAPAEERLGAEEIEILRQKQSDTGEESFYTPEE